MLLEKITLGKTLEIFVERDGYRYRLVSKVEDTNARRVCVSLITGNNKVFKFLPEDKVRILYRDEDQMWEWNNVRAGIAKLDNEPIHYFDIVDKGKSFNRRNAFRVSLSGDMELYFYRLPGEQKRFGAEPQLPDDAVDESGVIDEKKMPERLVTKAIIKDVSELGVAFFSDFEFSLEDSFSFDIPTNLGGLSCTASVVRKSEMNPISSKYSYFYGCIFSKSDRRLLKVIMDIQREKLKRERE